MISGLNGVIVVALDLLAQLIITAGICTSIIATTMYVVVAVQLYRRVEFDGVKAAVVCFNWPVLDAADDDVSWFRYAVYGDEGDPE